MTTDAELLRMYAREGSQAAFAELVARHVTLVYRAALRQLDGDVHLAEDVTQTVFTTLALKAKALSGHTVLAAWLYATTHYMVANARRAERRRRYRDQEVYAMQDVSPESQAEWHRLRPVLDTAILSLGAADREAILLRFFAGTPYADIGQTLRVSEDAARKRVDRALEKLREGLARHGITSTSSALATLFANNVTAAAPAAFAGTVASTALAGAAATASAAAGLGFLAFMSSTKLAVGVAGLMAVIGVGLFWHQQQTNAELRREIASLRATAAAASVAQVTSTPTPTSPGAVPATLASPASTTPEKPPAKTVRNSNWSPDAPAPWWANRGMVPSTQWQDRGTATPAEALETHLWAMEHYDVDVLARTIGFGDAKAKVDAVFMNLPDDVRAKYDTPEKLWALLGAGTSNGPRVTGFDLMAEGQIRTDPLNPVTLNFRVQTGDGQVQKGDWIFESSPTGWRRTMPANKFVAKITEMFPSVKKAAEGK